MIWKTVNIGGNLSRKQNSFLDRFLIGGGWWIRTTEGIASRFTAQ